MAECKVAEKATDEDITNFKNSVEPKTKVVKCLLTCLAEKSGKVVYSISTCFYKKKHNASIIPTDSE